MVGIDAASSAQSKRAGTGVELGSIELGGGTGYGGRKTAAAGAMYSEGGTGGQTGGLRGLDGIVGDAGGVYHTGGGETARVQGVWGEQGGWDAFWGCSSVFRCSGAVAGGPEWGRAGDSAVVDERVDDDVAGRVDA